MSLSSIQDQISDYKRLFANSLPFRHLVIDDFLEADLLEEILLDFPLPGVMDIHGTNAKRLLGWQISPISANYTFKPSINHLFDYLKSQKLRETIKEITGIESLLVSDPDYYGSGLLLAARGGVHKVHADRTYHPNPNFFPRLVLLLYFNKNWQPDYGGSLQLWDKNIRNCVTIPPVFNRCVLFEITSTSYHSIEDVTCPDNVYRRALNYYYLSDQSPPNSYIHDTIFFPRPAERLAYWKACASSNFPKELIGTIASRSPIARKIYSTARFLIKGPLDRSNSKLDNQEELNRWADFNGQHQSPTPPGKTLY
jgi:Rps23 Pro-64 3,4-dihydroxylase Tpa1-like proline 4-hydroxylase